MSQPAVEATDIALLLRHHQDALVDQWGVVASRNYTSFSEGKIRRWGEIGLRSIIQLLESGPDQLLEDHLTELALSHLDSGASVSTFFETFLFFKEVVLDLILRSYPSNTAAVIEGIRHVDCSILGLLGRFGNQYTHVMRARNYHGIQARLEESESLARTTTALLEPITLDEVLEIVCTEACRLTGATGSSVLLLEEEGWMRVAVSTGETLPARERLPVEGSLAGQAVRQGEPLVINDPNHKVQAYNHNANLQSLLVVPLRGKEAFIGALDVVNKPGGFSEESVRIMELFAAQAAIAIENARLHHQAEELAVTQERQRLARELHDSVTQVLYTASLYTDAARMALSSAKHEVAQGHLNELRGLVREALLEMRLLIFELYPPLLVQEGLVAALQARLESVEMRAGVITEFIVEGERHLPPSVETEIYRIAQEALTNVVKHARAHDVSVRLRFEKQRLCLEVQDNGMGFDPDRIEMSGGVGLRSMEERVRQIGGTLSIDSLPGQGTTLRVVLEV